MTKEFIIGIVISIPVAVIVAHVYSSLLWGAWFRREAKKIREG